jgi:hypothetical protein
VCLLSTSFILVLFYFVVELTIICKFSEAWTEPMLRFYFSYTKIPIQFLIFKETEDGYSYCDTRYLEGRELQPRIVILESMKKSVSTFNSGHYELVTAIEGYASVTEFASAVIHDSHTTPLSHMAKTLEFQYCIPYVAMW